MSRRRKRGKRGGKSTQGTQSTGAPPFKAVTGVPSQTPPTVNVREADRVPIEEYHHISSPGYLNTPPTEGFVGTRGDLTREYVASIFYGLIPSITSLPHHFDDLSCEFGVEVYERMMTDPETAAAVNLLVLASCSSPVNIVPALPKNHDQYELSAEIARFVQWSVGTHDWGDLEIRRAIVKEALVYGSGVGELTFEVIASGRYKGFLGLKKVRPLEIKDTAFVVDIQNNVVGLLPKKLPNVTLPISSLIPLKIRYEDEGGVEGGHYEIETTVFQEILPASKFITMTWNKRKNDPRGQSILRPAYTPWWIKQQTQSLFLEWLAKYSQPSIWGTTPENAVAVCEVDEETGAQTEVSPQDSMLNALRAFRNASVISLPHGSELHSFEHEGTGDIFLKTFEWADRQITRSILMQHIATQGSEHSGQSSAEAHQDVLGLLIVALRLWQAQAIRRDIVTPLVISNYGEGAREFIPRVDLGDGDGFPITPMEVAQLQNAGWFSDDQRPAVDRIIGLPVRRQLTPSSEESSENGSEEQPPV